MALTTLNELKNANTIEPKGHTGVQRLVFIRILHSHASKFQNGFNSKDGNILAENGTFICNIGTYTPQNTSTSRAINIGILSPNAHNG